MANTLFGDFSFTPNSETKEDGRRGDASDFSPRSHRQPFSLVARQTTPSPPCAVRDLAEAMDQQNLRPQVTDDKDAVPAPPTTSDLASSQTSSPTSTSVSRLNSATRRMQRQANVRMLSSASHARDIAELVHKMIEVDDQCRACDDIVASSEEDEGVDLGSWSNRMNRNLGFVFPGAPSWKRRFDNRREDASRVSKKPRMRKNRSSRRCER